MKKSLVVLIVSLASGSLIAATTVTSLVDTLVSPHTYGNASELSSTSLIFDDTSSNEDGSISSDSSASGASSDSSGFSSSESSSSKTTAALTSSTYKCHSGKAIAYHLIEINLKTTADLHRNIYKEDGNYGKGIKATVSNQVSQIEESGVNVLAAINGDTCFFDNENKGYVIADGVTYRESQRSGDQDDFALLANGSVMAYNESDYSLSQIQSLGCYQNWVFGPTLVKDGAVAVGVNDEISTISSGANQRTALGFVGPRHFFFLTTDINGSRRDGYGYTLYDLANLLKEKGCAYAYNLDGGGSATMYMEGEGVVNTLTEGERKLSDCIYVLE